MESRYFWLIEVLAGFGFVLGVQYGLKKMFGKRPGRTWSSGLGHLLQAPLTTLIWILVVLYFVDVVGRRIGVDIVTQYLGAMRRTAVVGCSAWVFFRWKKTFEQAIAIDPLKKVDLGTVRTVA